MDEPVNLGGRPTLYTKEHCEMLIEHMRNGLSFKSFAGVAGVQRSTLYNWLDANPEFKEAKEIGEDLSLLFWEKMGIDNIINRSESFGNNQGGNSTSLNATVWIFNMKNRFGWRDRQPDENDQININLSLADRVAKARARVKK